jgi:toxin ParE1/3/4
MSAIHAAAEFIAEHPLGSEGTDDPNIRVNVVHRYRHKIFYRIVDEAIEILHIRHTSRRPWIGQR